MPVSIGAHEFGSIPPHPEQPVTAADVFGDSPFGSNLRLFETNRCFRFAIKPEQGKDWSEFGGFGWVFPEPNVGGIPVYTDLDQLVELIVDQRTGLIYNFATRNGPAGSGLVKTFVDKQGGAYVPGYEIAGYLRLKEHRGNQEHDLIQHLESHLYLRPQDEANQGAAGYDANGFREAQQIDLRVYVDGNVDLSARTLSIPSNGDITFDRLIEAHRIQLEIAFSTSELKIVGASTKYEQRDERGSPDKRIMNERDGQLELGAPLLWVSRGGNSITQNKATDEAATGSIFSEITGPDNRARSAMMFSSTSTLTYALDTTSYNDFTIMMGLANILVTTTLLQFANGTGRLELVFSNGQYELQFTDANGSYSENLEWDGNGWLLVKVTRRGDRIYFSENGQLVGSELIDDVDNGFGGNVTIPAATKNMFDIRLYSSYISEDINLYYYRDITENEGKALLWL